MELRGKVIHPGRGRGRILALARPLSLWGGVDPERGTITDPRHPQHGIGLAGQLLVMVRAIGSSSSSAIMLELLRNRVAPAGIVTGRPDAILVLGVLVAGELGYNTIPVVQLEPALLRRLTEAHRQRASIANEIIRLE